MNEQHEAQLKLMHESSIYKVVESHDGEAMILYKTYEQAREAGDRRDSIENAAGAKTVAAAKARLGDTYYTGKDSSETTTLTLGNLIGFQATGLIVVMLVIIGLCALCYLMTAVLKAFGFVKSEEPKNPPAVTQPIAAAAAPGAAGAPNAPSAHAGFTNAQLQAFLTTAAIAALKEEERHHPTLSNEQLAVIFALAAAEVLGAACNVIKFRPVSAMDMAWTMQGLTELHSNGR
ncbi:MAG: hypothetical protein LBR60_04875 [Fibrobacter sp.]|jgi:Na+-transporting methylmalonyl-CoA/oxaloacetate decarboxylase gamma subunit|nr:hypothetical protein [Fibrobacter sp.]